MNTVDENIKKARRTAHSLMSAGFHGNNGLDPSTSIHILKTYVIPTITYGLEVLIPDKKNITRLDCFFKKLLKQILSLPQNVADPVPYIISLLIPIEGQIHLKILTFMYKISLLSEDSTEKKIARLAFKDINSNSWFTEVKSLMWKYDLPEIYWLLESPYTKYQWKKLLYEQVNSYWKYYMIETSKLYKSIDFLNTEIYKPVNNIH